MSLQTRESGGLKPCISPENIKFLVFCCLLELQKETSHMKFALLTSNSQCNTRRSFILILNYMEGSQPLLVLVSSILGTIYKLYRKVYFTSCFPKKQSDCLINFSHTSYNYKVNLMNFNRFLRHNLKLNSAIPFRHT